MTWLNLILLFAALIFPGASGAAPCAANLPERLIPQAGERGVSMWPNEIIQQEYQSPQFMATKGFDHLVGMLNAVTVYPCERSQSATIEIQKMELVRFKPEGGFVTEAIFSFDGQSTVRLHANHASQWKRSPEWFKYRVPLKNGVIRNTGGAVLLDTRLVPEHIIHMWTAPRTRAVPGARYGILAVVRVTGDARLQFGMDYWRGESSDHTGWSEGCVTSNNCEAWLSDWIGDTKGEFQQVLVPRAFSRSQ